MVKVATTGLPFASLTAYAIWVGSGVNVTTFPLGSTFISGLPFLADLPPSTVSFTFLSISSDAPLSSTASSCPLLLFAVYSISAAYVPSAAGFSS